MTMSTESAAWLLTVSPQGTSMRPILLNVSVNDLDDRNFTHSKPDRDIKPGDGRYAGGRAERKMKFSRTCRNEVSEASGSLTRTSPKS